MTLQSCPNCQKVHDVSVFVTGQRVLCACGIRFEVRRTDVAAAERAAPSTSPERAASPVAPSVSDTVKDETFIAPHAVPVLPGFSLIEVLGRGGMGEVWRARQQSLGREVAVKLLPPRLASDPEFVARFDKEATALAALSHPNIVQIIDRGVAGEHYFFVMEYVQGRTLRELMEGGKLSLGESVGIAAQICRAIDYAHEQQIIHRDLKPENILVDPRGNVKVADFGLAGIQIPNSNHKLTATAVAMGTLNYMAPEQRRDAKHVDGRADLYSVGVILYELLTGDLPLGRFKLPSEKVPGLDRRFDAIVSKLLDPEPSARYARGSEVVAALEAWVSVTPVAAPVPAEIITTPIRSPSSLQKGWHGLRNGLAVIGALVAVAVGVKILAPRVGVDSVKHRTLPVNTENQVRSAVKAYRTPEGLTRLELGFDDGEEPLNCHAGDWVLKGGVLGCTQAGNVLAGTHLKVVPRAYLAHRYFSADRFSAEVEMALRGLEPDYGLEGGAQRFAELSFRMKNVQVSLFAVPGTGLKLAWRYSTPDGTEVQGDSTEDVEKLLGDPVELPPEGEPFKARLTLLRRKGGVEVEAFANGQQFIKKTLHGLEGQTAKVALGCRNLHCTFDELHVEGQEQERPVEKDARR